MPERVQKFLANLGIASRREIERWIRAGDIIVDDKVCELGQRVTGCENILIRGEAVNFQAGIKTRVLMYHKPCGEVVTRMDPQQRPTIFENLPKINPGRWISIGRLDINTSGLMLLTTNGELANQLMHPRNEIEREYLVRVHGNVSDEMLSRLQQGIQLEDGPAKLTLLETHETQGTNSWYRIVITEGRNKEVRRIWESQGVQVSRLVRTRFGIINLPRELRRGSYAELSEARIQQLNKLIK